VLLVLFGAADEEAFSLTKFPNIDAGTAFGLNSFICLS